MARMGQVLPSYTPWAKEAMSSMGDAVVERGDRAREQERNQLASAAYMGDPEALQELAAVDPEMAMKVEAQSGQRSARERQAEAHQTAQTAAESRLSTEQLNRIGTYDKVMGSMIENVGNFDDFEAAKAYADQEGARLNELYGDLPDYQEVQELTPEMYESAKAMAQAELDKKGWTRSGSTEVVEYTDPETGDSYMTRVQPFTDPKGNLMSRYLMGADGKPMQAGTSYDAAQQEVIAGSKRRGTETEGRNQDIVTGALEATVGIQDLQRAKELLEVVSTGGLKKNLNAVRQYFGDDSKSVADMGELQTLLAQDLIEKFSLMTGVLSESDMKLLESMSAGAGRSTATNMRLIDGVMRRTKRKVARGLDRATDPRDRQELMQAAEALGIDVMEMEAPDEGDAPASAGASREDPLTVNRGDPKPPSGTWAKLPDGRVIQVP